ncbi:MAG: crosslink repair DNA glycosylase YcaQ family protein [Anaerolineales bacterium]|jgi:hypothetical protein
MTVSLNKGRWEEYRQHTFRLTPDRQLRSKQEAISFVKERGFVFFWPIQGILLPNLWQAVAGDRPVASEHDDPGHVTWGWKDSLLGERLWYYAKILRKRATIVSLEVAPLFYALSENYGSPEEDYRIQYEQGRMTQEAKSVYEALLHKGPLDTVALRKASRLSSRESDYRFNRALVALQSDLKILPIGVAQAGAWNYAFVYDLVPRHFPDLPEQARFIQENHARRELARLYLESVGAVQSRDVVKLFGWSRSASETALQDLVSKGLIQANVSMDDESGTWYTLTSLLEGSSR